MSAPSSTDLELARRANDRALTIQQAALACAQILERLAAHRVPISPSQALAVPRRCGGRCMRRKELLDLGVRGDKLAVLVS